MLTGAAQGPLRMVVVRGTDAAFGVPPGWRVTTATGDPDVRFFAQDADGSGDNVVVAIQHGTWWTDLDEYRAAVWATASASQGSVIVAEAARVDGHSAFRHLECDATRVFAYMEVRLSGAEALAVGVTVDARSRRVVDDVLRSVRIPS